MSDYYAALKEVLNHYLQPEGPEHGYSSPYNSTPRYPIQSSVDEIGLGNYAVGSNGYNTMTSFEWRDLAKQDMAAAVAAQKARDYANGVGDVYGPGNAGGRGVSDHVQPLPYSPVGGGADKQMFLREQQQRYANHPDAFEESMRGAPDVLKNLARALQDTEPAAKGDIRVSVEKAGKRK